MMKKTRASRVAFLAAATCRVVKNRPPDITISDFLNFWVSDSAEPCCACDTNPPRCPAPVGIKDKHYCLWCALEIARDLLEGSQI
jgi:hypothetical protein